MSFEGGFQGRTNKLVDGCYSFWDVGMIAILSMLGNRSHKGLEDSPLCNNGMGFD